MNYVVNPFEVEFRDYEEIGVWCSMPQALSSRIIVPDRVLDLDQYDGHHFDVWTSTPAVLWTANRPQEKGIHVHVYDGTKRIIDDTFGEVIYKGKTLDRNALWNSMIGNTLC